MTQTKLVYRPTEGESLSQTVIRGVADAKGVDQMDLDERLFDCIDPDALDRLFAPSAEGMGTRSGVVVFTMDGCRVEVENADTVVVKPSRAAASKSPARA